MATLGELEVKVGQLSAQLEALDRLFIQATKDRDEAVKVAFATLEKRLDGLNELRSMATDQSSKFLTRVEYTTHHDDLERRVGNTESRMDKAEAKGAGINTGWLYLVALVGVVVGGVSIIEFFLKP